MKNPMYVIVEPVFEPVEWKFVWMSGEKEVIIAQACF